MSVPVNRSGVVINANGQRLFGMDAAHYQKMQSKESPDWDKHVLAWLSALLGEKFESDDLWVVLKNGIVLIRVINTLKPGTIPKYNKTRLVALLEMDNIQLYLKACWQLGLPSQFIFSSSDLHKRSDMRAVARNIEALSKLAPSFGIASPAPLDSSKKGPPPKVALVEESGGAPEPVDFAEKVVQLRDTINKTKQQIEAFEAEEEQLRTNIREERSNWQKEKMQLVYQLSAAEKRVKSVVSSSSASGAAAAAVAPSPSVSRIQEYKSSELDDLKNKTKTEERLWQTAKERKKQLADEEEALLRDIEKLKQALKRPAAPIVTPVVEEEEEDKRGSRLVAASNSNCFFLQTEVTTPENVAHLTQRLEALMRDKTVEFEDLFSLKRLLETDEGRRVFCFVLFAQIRARKQRKTKKEEEKMVLLSVQNFDLVLWLFNTVVQSLSRQDVKTDYFATRVILKYSSRIVRRAAGDSGFDSIRQYIRSDPVWSNVLFWQELLFGSLNKQLKQLPGPTPKKEKKLAIKLSLSMLQMMTKEWKLENLVLQQFVDSISETLSFDASEQKKLLRAAGVNSDVPKSPRKSAPEQQQQQQQQAATAAESAASVVFGSALHPHHLFPQCIWQIIRVLETSEKCWETPGIFRESGDQSAMSEMRAILDQGGDIDYDNVAPHDLAGMFKAYLRLLPEPLTTFEAYSVIQTAQLIADAQDRFVFVRRVFSKLPEANLISLKRVLRLLRLYSDHSEKNKMSVKNLAVCFAPALFRDRKADMKAFADASKYADLLAYMIENCETVLK